MNILINSRRKYFVKLSLSILAGFIFLLSCSGSGGGTDPNTSDGLGILKGWREANQGLTLTKTGTAIGTVGELKNITANGEYYLTANIDLTNQEWTPLHTTNVPFTGTLHGNGYIIYNLKIDAPDKNYQGLFASLSGATISNLGIGVDSISANAMVGALAGRAANNTLDNIAVAPMDADSVITADGTVASSTSTGIIAYTYMGGVIGRMDSGTLTRVLNDGLAITSTGTTDNHGNIGGLIGWKAGGTVTGSSSADIVVNGGGYIGGLLGVQTTGSLIGSASGDVSGGSGGNSTVSGLVGKNDSGTVIGTTTGNVVTSSSRASDIGEIVGINGGGTVIGCASGNLNINSKNNIGGLIGGTLGDGQGYSTGWVILNSTNTSTSTYIGAVLGNGEGANLYYNNAGGDHVGTDAAITTKFNEGKTGATGDAGTNGIGTGIDGIANATAANMSGLTKGTEVGQWTFTPGQWPRLNLPEGVIDYMDYTKTPAQPDGFVD